jgi:hypothetical protein
MTRERITTLADLSQILRSPFLGRAARSIAAVVALATSTATLAQSSELLGKLNAPWALVTEQGKSATRIFTAYLDMTKAPREVGADFNQTTIYPGMEGFDEVAKWAEANANMGKTLLEVQNCQVLGVPYGTDGVDARFVERKLVAELSADGDLARMSFPYLDAIEAINAYVAADMYRLCEAGKFDDAFNLGVAHARVLRQAIEATMFDEKFAAMTMLSDALSVHRDMLWVYSPKMSVALLQRLAKNEYPFLKPSDNERLKRIAMPEGDLIVGTAMLESVFDSDGQPNLEKFAQAFSGLQAAGEPLTGFGAAKRWSRIASVHGSLEASNKKLTDIYDDWWRRWRMRPFDPMMAIPTELSRANPVRYAAVVLVARDIESLFELRRRLACELCGTVISAGLAGYKLEFGDWPKNIEMAYAQFMPKRFDFDSYDKDYGSFIYDFLGSSSKGIESEFGRIEVRGCVLFARNGDGESNKAVRHAVGGRSDDFVLWPALRAISRGQAQ